MIFLSLYPSTKDKLQAETLHEGVGNAEGAKQCWYLQVQLWYSIVVITVMLSVHYVTPHSQRGVVLWLPPFLQLLPAVALLFSPAW